MYRNQSIYLSNCQSIFILSIYISIYLYFLSIYLSFFLPIFVLDTNLVFSKFQEIFSSINHSLQGGFKTFIFRRTFFTAFQENCFFSSKIFSLEIFFFVNRQIFILCCFQKINLERVLGLNTFLMRLISGKDKNKQNKFFNKLCLIFCNFCQS